jgi:hypothetical protein
MTLSLFFFFKKKKKTIEGSRNRSHEAENITSGVGELLKNPPQTQPVTHPRRKDKNPNIQIGGSVTLSHRLQPILSVNRPPSNGLNPTPYIPDFRSGPHRHKLN